MKALNEKPLPGTSMPTRCPNCQTTAGTFLGYEEKRITDGMSLLTVRRVWDCNSCKHTWYQIMTFTIELLGNRMTWV